MNAQSKNISVGGYYAGWMQGWYNNGRLPAEKIDFSVVDYVIHFALFPKADGTFDDLANSILESNSAALVKAAHSAGKKVLISVGGWNSADAFRSAVSGLNLVTFVFNLVTFMTVRGYDGIDIDWEPLQTSDAALYITFIKTLRSAMNTRLPRRMLMAANGREGSIFAQIHQHFDQINLMTYDLSGPWGGWVTWHNAPVYDGDYQFPNVGGYVPSASRMVEDFISAGVPANKIGIGIDFYGYVWKGGSGTNTGGVTEPRQQWANPPELFPNVPYFQIMEQYYSPHFYRWDSSAAASYLTIDTPCDWNDMFITYDDERTSKAKVELAKKKSLAGVFIWELGAGVISDSAKQPLMSSIKSAVKDSITIPPIPELHAPSNQTEGLADSITLSWYAVENADAYRMQLSVDSAFADILLDSTIVTATSIFIEDLPDSQKYFWRVSAVNDSGSSSFSSARVFATATALLNYPLLIFPADSTSRIPIDVIFKWSQIANAKSYNLQIANTPNICDLVIDTLIVNDTTFAANKLEYNKVYYWRARSLPKGNSSYAPGSFSEWNSFATTGFPPAIPLPLFPPDDAKNISLNPTFRWQAAEHAQNYSLRVAGDSDFSQTIIDTAGLTETNFKVQNLFPNTTYYWSVKANNEFGESSWSETRKFATASVNDQLTQIDGAADEFKLYQNYPNPFNPETNIEYTIPITDELQRASPRHVTLIVYDILGQEIATLVDEQQLPGKYSVRFNGTQISNLPGNKTDLRYDLPSGIYFYTIWVGDSSPLRSPELRETKKMLYLK